jgi:energy-converting hydrogenase Eha subunit E
LSLLGRGDWGWRAREDTEARAFNVRDVGHGTTTVSLVFLPFELTHDALALLYFLQARAQ